ncbi:MAG: S41 family peptidase [Chloroflexota bacterium]
MLKNKVVRVILVLIVVGILISGSFAGGFLAGHYIPVSSSVLPSYVPTATISVDSSQGGTPQDLQTLFKPFWETWQILHDNYVDQPLDNLTLMRGAITGMMESLGDQHSSYMDPQEYSDANVSINGKYEGIGAYVDTTGEYLTIINPMKGFPAEKAGLMPGDEIRAIDGEDMTGINPELVRLKVIGPAGSSVHLSVYRSDGDQTLEFDIVRENINIPSVTGELTKDNLAYVTITTFGDETTSDLRRILKELMPQKPKGLILDLRDNGGGYLTTAIEVASEFIGDGVIMVEQYGDDTRETYEAIKGGQATDIPMIVLVNEFSASASEIVAGAIQDRGRAQLLGVTTYGKGSVQNWIPLSDNQGAIRVTVAKWLTPNGNTIHEIGLSPDVVVERTTEDYKAGLDPQLDAAIAILLKP